MRQDKLKQEENEANQKLQGKEGKIKKGKKMKSENKGNVCVGNSDKQCS